MSWRIRPRVLAAGTVTVWSVNSLSNSGGLGMGTSLLAGANNVDAAGVAEVKKACEDHKNLKPRRVVLSQQEYILLTQQNILAGNLNLQNVQDSNR